MAARVGHWTLIPPTPPRDDADVNTIALKKAFFEDFPGPIASKAVEYAKIFENKGFDSKESLKAQAKWKGGRSPSVMLFRSLSRYGCFLRPWSFLCSTCVHPCGRWGTAYFCCSDTCRVSECEAC